MLKSLVPVLKFLSDFGDVLITDDKLDLNRPMSNAIHPSPIHHYQFGFVMKGLSEMAMKLINFGEHIMIEQDRQNQDLQRIVIVQQMMKDESYFRQHQYDDKAERVRIMKEYWDRLMSDPSKMDNTATATATASQAPRGVIYGGNINQLRRSRPKALPLKPIPKPPSIKM